MTYSLRICIADNFSSNHKRTPIMVITFCYLLRETFYLLYLSYYFSKQPFKVDKIPISFFFFCRTIYFIFFSFFFYLFFIYLFIFYFRSPSWTLLPPPSPYHPSWSSQCTSPQHPASCIEPGLASHFIHDISHVSMPFSQIFPPSPSPHFLEGKYWNL